MEGLVNVRSDRAIKRALATGLLGMTSKDFQSWQDKPEKWDAWVDFSRVYEIWRKKGIYVALCELFRKTRAIPLNLKRPDGERKGYQFSSSGRGFASGKLTRANLFPPPPDCLAQNPNESERAQ